MTAVSPRSRLASSAAFAAVALSCAAFFSALLLGKCRVCSTSFWELPFGGTVIWALAAWITTVHPLTGLTTAVAASVGHAALVLADWSGACAVCLAILALEGIVSAFAAWQLRPWPEARMRPVRAAALLLAVAGAGVIGGIAVPRHLYADCPDDYRRAPAPKFKQGEPTLLLFVEPGCPYCSKLRQSVLSTYGPSLQWVELSRCTTAGRSMMKSYHVSGFPTLIVEQDGQTLVDAEGIEEIRLALRHLNPQPASASPAASR